MALHGLLPARNGEEPPVLLRPSRQVPLLEQRLDLRALLPLGAGHERAQACLPLEALARRQVRGEIRHPLLR